MNTEPQTELTEIIDGMIWDTSTGECLGVQSSPAFSIDNEEKALWLLKKMQSAMARAESMETTPAVIAAKAVLANAEAMKKAAESRYYGLETRFGAELARWAKTQLEGKSRTHQTLYGSIAFKSVPERIKVADPELALAWARTNCPEAIKHVPAIEEFQISKMKGVTPDFSDPDAEKAFRKEPAGESFKIMTGAEK